jgi:hypothetical protein
VLEYDVRDDAYSLLGVHPESGANEIEEAYRRAALRWHPDKSPAPDAGQWFVRIQKAAQILRDPARRREYDRGRARHFGARSRAPRYRKTAPEPYKPVPPAPASVTAKHSIIRDAVLFHLPERPRGFVRELGVTLAFVAFAAALFTGRIQFALIALVGYALVRVDAQPPSPERLRWAKVVPGSHRAECATLHAAAGHVVRHEVPYARLAVAVVAERRRYRVEIQGFPVGAVALTLKTRDAQAAQRCAREASRWLHLPLAA